MPAFTSPWPYDAILNGVGVRLKPLSEQGGILVGRKLETLDRTAPTEWSYSAQSPYGERTSLFRLPVLGMGQRSQQTPTDRAYSYALNVDASIAGWLMLGPACPTVTPASTGSVSRFIEALHAGSRVLFAAAGRYLLRRQGDTGSDWVVSKDFGAGRSVIDAVRFKHAGASPVDALYVTLDNGEFWRYDGSTWSQGAGLTRYRLAVWGDELWAFDGSLLKKVTDDPFTAGNWAGSYTIGDGSSTVNTLAVHFGQLYIVKENGKVYTLSADGIDTDLFPGLQASPSADYGRGAVSWGNHLWLPLGQGFCRLSGGGTAELETVGPEKLLANQSEVQGQVVAFAGHSTWFGYAGVYNAVNGNSYLLKYGTWLNADADGAYQFAPVWHGAIVAWSAKQITALAVSTLPGPNPRLYAGFSDGSLGWMVLPRSSPNPLLDTNCRYQTSGTIYFPLHDMGFPPDTKSFRGLSVIGPTLNVGQTATARYRTDPTQGYTDLGQSFTVSGQRINLPATTYGKQFDLGLVLETTADTATPVVELVALHEAVRPSLRLIYDLTVLAGSRLGLHNGARSVLTGEQLRAHLRATAAQDDTFVAVFPEGDSQDVSVQEYQEILLAQAPARSLAWEITLRLVQYATLTQYGLVDRLGPYTVDDLGVYTVDQLGVL